jgi:hypothetical protein
VSLAFDLTVAVGHYLSKIDRQIRQMTVKLPATNRIVAGFSEISNRIVVFNPPLKSSRSTLSEKAVNGSPFESHTLLTIGL